MSITDESGTTPCDKDTVTCEATDVTGSLTVTASFAALGTYSITPTHVGEGTINCDADKVTEDDSVVFKCTADPKDGHELVGNLTLTGGNSTDTCTQKAQDKWECSATNVTSPLVVTAFFEPKTYKVQPADTIANGSLENCTPTTVKHGENASVTCDATPTPGFEFASLTLSDGTSSETCKAKTCSLPNAAGDVEITASFTKVHHAITYAITGNGSIDCTPNPVPDGEKVTCTATPADGYKLELGDLSLPDTVGWKCDLAAMTCSTTSGVTSPLNVGATFTARNSGSNGGSTGGGGGSAPTMSELGLLLSGLALAGAAAPALRRREKQGKKADTSK
ncbi:MAG: hypothetical protein IJM64_06335 [Ottowia sp.]|nr:hypothetical protein [Ottowia sp.]